VGDAQRDDGERLDEVARESRMSKAKSAFEEIPGVGPSIASDLESLGYRGVAGLRGQDPEAMYEGLMRLQGSHVDRCMLYVFRCAVYYAEGGRDAERLKWWTWKDL
jgi:hypothetical protein